MKRLFPEESGSRARIEIIPMIDIMFFLLVVFIFISLSLIKLEGVSLELPTASSSPISAREKPLDISIRKDGSLYFGQEKVTRSELKNQLEALSKGGSPKRQLIISGDRSSRLQTLVDVMTLCQSLGYADLSVRTQSP
jgi:biopolymer transport protein ExbD